MWCWIFLQMYGHNIIVRFKKKILIAALSLPFLRDIGIKLFEAVVSFIVRTADQNQTQQT
jgi:hypothetical protein